MKQKIRNQFTGEVIYTAEIDCPEDAPKSIKLGLAVRAAVKARADLTRADLTRADLTGANLTWANLSGTNLSGAKGILPLPIAEPRHYRHVAVWHGEWIIFAGCRRLTIPEARAHWLSDTYSGPASVRESYGPALDWLEKQEGPE